MESPRYRLIGYTTDGQMLFQDLDYPSDAPQSYLLDAALHSCASNDCRIDGDKYFAITERHAEVRGLLGRSLDKSHDIS